MSNPKWRRKLRELVGAELAPFIPQWAKLKPPDVPQDFLIELEFYDWWQAVKTYASRGEFHPSIHNHPRRAVIGNDGNYKSVDLNGTGLPRKFERFYTKGLGYPQTAPQVQWPMTLIWPWVSVTLRDDGVSMPNKDYNPGESLCTLIQDNPQQFIDSLNFWHGHYQIYRKLTPIERQFLSAIRGTYSCRHSTGTQHQWYGSHKNLRWEPDHYFPGVDPTNYGRYLKNLESLGLIQIHRLGNGNITGFSFDVANTPIIYVCKVLLSE